MHFEIQSISSYSTSYSGIRGRTPVVDENVKKHDNADAAKAYLKYLYPQITRQISEFVEEVCDQMEHEGSLMFDQYPDRTALQILASGIEKDFRKKYPDSYSREDTLLRDMIEVVLFHEIMHRRYRYRSRRRLYL